jgi:F-type H+-transporting ATPase subunit delta
MSSSEGVETYARALFSLASLTDSVDRADEALSSIVAALRSHVGLRETLSDASVPAEARRAVIRELFAEADPSASAIAGLAIDNGDVELLEKVSRRLGEIAEKERGIVVARVTTALPLDDASRAELSADLTRQLGHPVSLRETVDPSILGGIIINVAGKVIDGSVSARLDSARRALSTVQIGGDA